MSLASPVVTNTNNSMILIPMPTTERRSVSPLTPSPSHKMRGVKLFRAISRKLARRSQDHDDVNYEDADSRSSSTDSCSSTSAGPCIELKKSPCSNGSRFVSPNRLSSSSSDTGSDTNSAKHRHSSSVESFRKVFQHMSLNSTRSQSCSNETKRKCCKKSAPKKILRSPVTYTYVRGLSGLPTQRIPKTASRMYMNNACGCSIQYMASLYR